MTGARDVFLIFIVIKLEFSRENGFSFLLAKDGIIDETFLASEGPILLRKHFAWVFIDQVSKGSRRFVLGLSLEITQGFIFSILYLQLITKDNSLTQFLSR